VGTSLGFRDAVSICVAIGLAFDALKGYTSAMPVIVRLPRLLFPLMVGLMLTVRLAGLWSLESMLWQGPDTVS
jgi:hypothetical protein